MKRKSELTAFTRKAFVAAFCVLYKDKPIEKITIQEIADKAGYNRSTFYQYFKDSYDLLAYLEDMLISQIRDNIIANGKRGDIGNIFTISFTNIQEGTSAYLQVLLVNSNSSRFIQRLSAALLPVFMEQLHIDVSDTNSIYILDFYLSGIASIARRWLKNGQEPSIEELSALIQSILTDGVLSALGHKA